jgi:hypothetical protein
MFRQVGEACRAGLRHGGFTEDEVFGGRVTQMDSIVEDVVVPRRGIRALIAGASEVVLVVAGLLRSKHGMHCAAKGASVAGVLSAVRPGAG